MRRQIKRVVATLLTASLIVPMCYGNKVSNAEMVKKNVTATAVNEDGSDGLTEITELHAASVDNKIEVRIWKNEEGKIFYSAYRNGQPFGIWLCTSNSSFLRFVCVGYLQIPVKYAVIKE